MNLLEVSGITTYSKGSETLKKVSFTFPSFKRLAIAGETGSGKTTLLKAMAGLLQTTEGEVRFEGEKVQGPDEQLLPGHPRIAYLSQYFELRNNYRVNDFLEMASKIGEARARRIYELCQISHLLHRRTDQLSGGERQRTALARLLTTSPKLLLLDEPFSNLDGIHKQQLKTVLQNLVEEDGIACIMVSHDPVDVLPWAEEIIVLKDGKIIQQGTPETIYARPVDVYVGGLFGDYNLLSAAEAEAVFGMKGQESAKQVFVRPEDIQLSPVTSDQHGRVTAVAFFGSYYEIEVEVKEVKLLARLNKPGWQKGDSLSVSLRQGVVWQL